jgi:polysaccharide deacetylase family protein (PEP-CTERM system associated)
MTFDPKDSSPVPGAVHSKAGPKNIMTVDVEDWLESSLELFDPQSPMRKGLSGPAERVETITRKLLDLMGETGAKGTFFVLGTVAQKSPDLVKEIHGRGHEIASHGWRHDLVYKLNPEAYREAMRKSIALLESLTGEKIKGYRAPYASITPNSEWALDVLQELGLSYDCSLFPIRRGLYGFPAAKSFPHLIREDGSPLIEFPMPTFRFCGKNLPLGGGYFRWFPYRYTLWGIKRTNRMGRPLAFYLHPYELDPEELSRPLPGEDLKSRLVRLSQGFNRARTEGKLGRLFRDFKWTSVSGWIAEEGNSRWLASQGVHPIQKLSIQGLEDG